MIGFRMWVVMVRNRDLWRYMHTTQERRRWYQDAFDVALRLKRSPRNLPTVWDDIVKHIERSWKAHRKTRWRRIAKV